MTVTTVVSPLRGLVAFAILLSLAPAALAADATFVGIIALAMEDDVAEQLEMSDELKANLSDLVGAREDEALELALELKDLSPEEQKEKLKPFVAESEKLGLALLSESQRKRLAEIRIAKAGLETLVEPAIAEQVDLIDVQVEEIKTLLAKRAETLAEGNEEEQRLTKIKFERSLAEVLTAKQKAAWEQLAGFAEGEGIVLAEEPAEKVEEEPEEPANPQVDPPAAVAEAPLEEQDIAPGGLDSREASLRFSFRYAPWKDVLDWFAAQADLSLVLEAPPAGTFNYTDTRKYTPAEAIDLLNSVLLTKGFTLVRRQRMLILINLEDGIPPNLVSQVPYDELDDVGKFELVSCLFQLDKLAPEEAQAEVQKLIGPQGSIVVLSKAKQLFITETGGKLRTIRTVIEAIENPKKEESNLTVIALQHAAAEEVLITARELLGMPEEVNSLPDGSLRIAVDPLGTRLLVNGQQEMIDRLQEVVKLVDIPLDGATEGFNPVETPQLEVYPLTAADPAAVLQVMQTLLAGLPDVRLTTDPRTGALVALARPSQHATIRATLDQMQRDGKVVEVIQLRRVDPQVAVLSINKLFGAGEAGTSSTAPLVDADPISAQLLVRGTQMQVDQIRELLKKMGEDEASDVAGGSTGGNVRLLPFTGNAAEAALLQMQEVWPTMRRNRIRVVTPSAVSPTLKGLREIRGNHEPEDPLKDFDLEKLFPELGPVPQPAPAPAPQPEEKPEEQPKEEEAGENQSARAVRNSYFKLAAHPTVVAQGNGEAPAAPAPGETPAAPAEPRGEPAEIIVTVGPTGILIASDDLEALDEFEALFRTLTESTNNAAQEFTVFYLKYAKADVASQLLEDILGGGGGGDAGGGSIMGDLASSMLGDVGGGLLGGLMGLGGGGGGGAIQTAGAVKFVPDLRLNALVVQAGPADLDLIEQLLKVIDQEFSPENVQTSAPPRLIPVVHMKAEEIANIVKQVYADRLTSTAAGGQQRQPSPEDFIRALRGGGRSGRGGGGDSAKSEAEKMTIGVDARSNSLVVSAPEPLFQEVKELVAKLDQAGTEGDEQIVVVTLKRANPQLVRQALNSIVGNDVKASTSSAQGQSSNNSNTSNSGDRGRDQNQRNQQSEEEQFREAIRQRMQFIQQMQQGGGDRGGRGGSSRGGFPGGGGGSGRGGR